jgi:hypothetical protein
MSNTFTPIANSALGNINTSFSTGAYPIYNGITAPHPATSPGPYRPIDPLPGNAGTGSWAISLFWTLPLVPFMAKLFLLSALGMR